MAASSKKSDFQKVQDEWYTKLKNDGFVDIEQDEDNLKVWSAKFKTAYQKLPKEVWVAKATYYQMAENFLQDYKFATKIERIIWEYHANGISFRDIATTLNKAKVTRTNRDNIWKVVKKLKTKMYTLYVTLENGKEYHE